MVLIHEKKGDNVDKEDLVDFSFEPPKYSSILPAAIELFHRNWPWLGKMKGIFGQIV